MRSDKPLLLLSLFLHQYVPKTRAFHLKRDQDVFERIAVVFVHYQSINLDDFHHFFFREKNNFLCLFRYI